MQVKAKELRTDTKRILDTVDRGEEVVISYRGKARARLVGLDRGASQDRLAAADSPLFGMWRDHEALNDVETHIDKLRSSRY